VVIGAPIVVAAAVASLIAVNQHRSNARRPPTPASSRNVQAWSAPVTDAVRPMASELIGLLQTANAWEAGNASSTAVGETLTADLPTAITALRALERLPALPEARGAQGRYLQAIELYVAAFRVEFAATQLPSGPLQRQLQRSFARVRLLGDRVYDDASSLLSPYLTTASTGPPAQSRSPAAVPDWSTLGLGAGPPLGLESSSSNDGPPSVAPRSQAPTPQWVRAVSDAGIPSAEAQTRALTTGSVNDAVAIADQLEAAVRRLDDAPDPAGHAAASGELRLGLLVDAEAARAAAAGSLAGATPATDHLRVASTILALIGDQLWDSQLLGARAHQAAGDPTALALNTRF
jgi:hypothetical protein